VIQHFEVVDAGYADLELEVTMPRAISVGVTALRNGVLEMQDRHGLWLESERSLGLAEAGHPEERFGRHQVYRDLMRISEHQEELIDVHLQMARQAPMVGGADLRASHEALAEHHRNYRRKALELGERLLIDFELDLEDREMEDPLEQTPREEKPDETLLL
jgi:hypothetical protein